MEDNEMISSVSNDSNYSAETTSDSDLESSSSSFLEDLSSETSSEDDVQSDADDSNQIIQEEWLDPSGNQPRIIPFTGRPGLKLPVGKFSKIEQFYLLLVTDDLFQEISNQTNLYATRVLSQEQSTRLNKWVPTSKNEIKSFFGLILWMGLVRMPKISLYWSKDPAFAQTFSHSVMSRNRFELLLRMVQFTNIDDVNVNERLHNIKLIVDVLNENFNKYYDPPETVYVDESVIPFRGGISLRKYIKQKRHKRGLKIFKLCSKQGYTHHFKIYAGKKLDADKVSPSNIVISLSEDILGKGHTIYTDGWYTSLELAQKLIEKNTHLVGKVYSHRQGLSKEVITKKLKQREMFAKEHRSGITLMKWKYRVNTLALSTKHSIETVNVRKKGHDSMKPALILDYNNSKPTVPIIDLFEEYDNPLQKTLKWYKKLAIELLMNTAVRNAWIMYNNANHTSISKLEYKEKLIEYLCNIKHKRNVNNEGPPISQSKKRHELKKANGNPAPRHSCISCYKQNVKNFNSKMARDNTKRVSTFCDDCPNKQYLCLPCFNEIHRKTRL